MLDYTEIFDKLSDFYCDRTEEIVNFFEYKDGSVGEASKVIFSLFHNVGVSYLKQQKTEADCYNYIQFLSSIYKASFNVELTQADYSRRFATINELLSGKTQIKTDFFSDLSNINETNSVIKKMYEPITKVYTSDVRHLANVYGNYLIYWSGLVKNFKNIERSKKYTKLVRGILGLSSIFNFLSSLEELF